MKKNLNIFFEKKIRFNPEFLFKTVFLQISQSEIILAQIFLVILNGHKIFYKKGVMIIFPKISSFCPISQFWSKIINSKYWPYG